MTKRTCAVLVLAALLGTADAQEGPPPRVAEVVAKLSEDGAAGAAAEELAKIGAPAVPALVAALGDAKAREGAIDALARIGPAAKDAVPALTALGQDLGAAALHRLGGAGWDAWRKALPNALIANQVTTPGCGKGSWRPADAWGAEGGRIWMTSACVQALAQCVDDPAKRPQMPADLRACVTALEKAAREQKPSVRAAASRALEAVRRAYR